MMDWFLTIRSAKLKALRLKYHAPDEEVRVSLQVLVLVY